MITFYLLMKINTWRDENGSYRTAARSILAKLHVPCQLNSQSPCSIAVVFKLWGAPPLGGARVLQGGRDVRKK